jgi:hypothetical protein
MWCDVDLMLIEADFVSVSGHVAGKRGRDFDILKMIEKKPAVLDHCW